MQLRDYQSAAVDATYKWFSDGKGNPLIVAPTGAGKSVILAEFIRRALNDYAGTRIICATHVKELIAQNAQALTRLWPDAPVGIYSAGLSRRQVGKAVTFAGIQSVHKRAASFGHIDLLIVDECFPAGTPISTPKGAVPIEQIKVGQCVENALGFGFVEAVKVSDATKIIEVKTDDGKTFKCTENHPIFTEEGWTSAGKLEVGRRLFSSEELRALRRGISPVDQAGRERGSDFFNEAGALEKAAFLLNLLLEESGERDAHSGCAGEAIEDASRYRAQAASSMGQRLWPNEAASRASELARGWMGGGARRSDKNRARRGISYGIQNRHCPPGSDDSDRGGRSVTLRQADTGGSPEGCAASGPRVVRISHQKCGRPKAVYNLQVSGHPSYFAAGILVHNCHLIPRSSGTMYQRFIEALKEINPYLKVIGLTATPFRLDSGRLDAGKGALFDGIAYDIPIPMLVERGYLAPLISKSPSFTLDTKGLHTRGGDWIESEMDAKFNTEAVTREAVREIIQLGHDRRSWLLFCISVDHATNVRDELRRNGVTAEVVTGATPPQERARILKDFKDGRIRAVTNVNVLTTGFDAPATDLLAFLRPTQSLGLYMQMAGRAMRVADGKENGLVLDYAGNVVRHGPVDAVNVQDAPGRAKDPDAEKGDIPAKTCPECKSILFIATMECPDCGYQFPEPEPKIDRQASTAAIMNMTAEDDWRPVQDFAVSRHRSGRTGQIMMKAEYLIDGRVVGEMICFEHVGFPRRKAVQWWHQNAGTTPPDTVAEAVERQGEIRVPAEVVIRREGKYDRIARTRGQQIREAAE